MLNINVSKHHSSEPLSRHFCNFCITEGHSIEACRDQACRTSKVNKRRPYQNPRNPRPTSDNRRSITRSKSNIMFTKAFKNSFAEVKYTESQDFKSKTYFLETTFSDPDEHPDELTYFNQLNMTLCYQNSFKTPILNHTKTQKHISYSSHHDFTCHHPIPFKPLSTVSQIDNVIPKKRQEYK
ncbi:hypothetical protein GEMRC1_013062 [Eukaryota sp. GEM-RC1]